VKERARLKAEKKREGDNQRIIGIKRNVGKKKLLRGPFKISRNSGMNQLIVDLLM